MYEIFEKLCQLNNVTPYKVGKATNIHTATFSDWKNGKSTPKQDKLKRIADYFNVSIEYLMTGDERKFSSGMAMLDVELTNQSNRIKEYMLKFAKLPTNLQEHIIDLIDVFDNKEG